MDAPANNSAHDIKEIFLEALEKGTEAERVAYLDGVCENNAALRQKVEALLLAHQKAGKFLDPAEFRSDITPNQSPLTEGPGTVIGRYKLLEKIGEGGMAVVYMAEQEEPIRRRVALKIIKLGMDTKQVIARFEAERQALALMDHPSIAKVLDAGATLMGRAACHTGQTVTWDQIMASRFQFCDYLDDLDYDSPAPVKADENGQFPLPIPGQWTEV